MARHEGGDVEVDAANSPAVVGQSVADGADEVVVAVVDGKGDGFRPLLAMGDNAANDPLDCVLRVGGLLVKEVLVGVEFHPVHVVGAKSCGSLDMVIGSLIFGATSCAAFFPSAAAFYFRHARVSSPE